MNINELNATMPKTSRAKDFEKYTSKAAFVAEAENVKAETREVIRNELANGFTWEVHESGQFLAVTLYFSGKDVAKEDRYRYVSIDTRGDELVCEMHDSIKATKQYIREQLGTAAKGEQRTVDIINKVEAEEEAKKKATAAKKTAAKKAG